MKASELMIGDWVFNAYHGENIQVTPYDFFTHGHFEDGKYIPTGVTPSNGWDLDPIPITPKILEKNGFKRVAEKLSDTLGESWVWLERVDRSLYSRRIEITLYTEPISGVNTLVEVDNPSRSGDGVNNIHSCDIDNVHELQHAIRLCGIEKEIVI